MKGRELQVAEWLRSEGPGYPLVLSSRARLARNLEGLPFPAAASEGELEKARGTALEAFFRKADGGGDWNMRFAEELPREDLHYMAEELLVGSSFGERPGGRALAISWPDARSITVNYEDHIRIQAVLPGSQVMKAWRMADEIDSRLEKDVHYCFDNRLGYLTSSPWNVGTGLRISAMLHLPALVISGEMARTMAAIAQAGMFVRGIYGGGSGVFGNIFQISNRRTLGRSEEELISQLESVIRQVADRERTARKVFKRDSRLELEDRVYRSLGVLERARRVGFYEAMELVSSVKLGVDTDILPMPDFSLMYVAVAICPYHLRGILGREVDEEDLDRERAVQIRRLLDL